MSDASSFVTGDDLSVSGGMHEVGDAHLTIIDVDAHFEPSANWLDEFPALKKKLPEMFPTSDPRFRMNSGEMFAYFVSDDLLRAYRPSSACRSTG